MKLCTETFKEEEEEGLREVVGEGAMDNSKRASVRVAYDNCILHSQGIKHSAEHSVEEELPDPRPPATRYSR